MTTPDSPSRTALAVAADAGRVGAASATRPCYLFFAFFDWCCPVTASFAGRSAGADFRHLVVMAMPVLAVLLASPRHAGGRRGQD